MEVVFFCSPQIVLISAGFRNTNRSLLITNKQNELLFSLKPSRLSSGGNTAHLVHLSHLVLVDETLRTLDNIIHLAIVLHRFRHLSHTLLDSQSTQEIALQ